MHSYFKSYTINHFSDQYWETNASKLHCTFTQSFYQERPLLETLVSGFKSYLNNTDI